MIAASWRVTGSSSGAPDLVSSTRKTSAAMSTRSQPSASTSLKRIPVKKPNQNASRTQGVLIVSSIPFLQRGSTSAGVEILRRRLR